jgi:putative heme transporter
VAVPLAATVNAVAQHLAANTRPGDDPEEGLEKDYHAEGERPPDDEPGEVAPPEPEDRDPSYGNRRLSEPTDAPEGGTP